MSWYKRAEHKLLDELQPAELAARRVLERLTENPGRPVALMLVDRHFAAAAYRSPRVLVGTVVGIYDARATYAMIIDDAEATLAEVRKRAEGATA